MCTARDPVAHYYACDYVRRARVFGGINFGDLVKNSPIRQIKIPAKVSGYTVHSCEICNRALQLIFACMDFYKYMHDGQLLIIKPKLLS